MKLFDRWYIQVLIITMWMLLVLLDIGYCECWDMIVSEGKYNCKIAECEIAPYEDKVVCENSAHAMTEAQNRRFQDEEKLIFGNLKPDLTNKERKGISFNQEILKGDSSGKVWASDN